MMLMMHKEMEVHPLAFLTSPLAGSVVSLIHVAESPQFPLQRDQTGCRAILDVIARRKNLYSCQESKLVVLHITGAQLENFSNWNNKGKCFSSFNLVQFYETKHFYFLYHLEYCFLVQSIPVQVLCIKIIQITSFCCAS